MFARSLGLQKQLSGSDRVGEFNRIPGLVIVFFLVYYLPFVI
jgi:hypothetical protein